MVIFVYSKDEVSKVKESDNDKSLNKIVDNKCMCPNIKNDAYINIQSNDTSNTSDSTNDSNKLININNASLDELMSLSGIGEAKAKAIIEYRKTQGNFEKIEDIMNVSGIGESAFEKIKDFITT